jgi:hypothetical protein
VDASEGHQAPSKRFPPVGEIALTLLIFSVESAWAVLLWYLVYRYVF